jgi:hypothetical protein
MFDDPFLIFWRSHYGDCPPVGFLLRETFPDRWFRIHSLPDSRRYANTAREMSSLLSRHNAVLSDLMGENGSCVVVANPAYARVRGRPPRSRRQLAQLGLQPLIVVTGDGSADPAAGWSIPLSSAHLTWQPNAIDDIIADVANNVVGPLLIVSDITGRVYAPYDGGADLFLASGGERDEFRERYAQWLSPHPSGL